MILGFTAKEWSRLCRELNVEEDCFWSAVQRVMSEPPVHLPSGVPPTFPPQRPAPEIRAEATRLELESARALEAARNPEHPARRPGHTKVTGKTLEDVRQAVDLKQIKTIGELLEMAAGIMGTRTALAQALGVYASDISNAINRKIAYPYLRQAVTAKLGWPLPASDFKSETHLRQAAAKGE